MDAVPFNGDEAIVGLMARHILVDGVRPIFFYGQAYMGSLDAYLVAAGFALFGEQIWVIRLIQTVLYLGTLASTVAIGKSFLGNWDAGMIAAILLAIPPVNVTLYTTASLGGYGEALLIGNLSMLSGMGWIWQMDGGSRSRSRLLALAFGACAGLGLWANGLTLIYSLPMAAVILAALIRQVRRGRAHLDGFLAAVVGFIAGSFPWWLYAFQHGMGSLVAELLGNNVAVETGPWFARVGSHLLSLVMLGGSVTFGFRPPWEVRWLGLPLLPFILILWAGILFLFIKSLKLADRRMERWVLAGIVIVFTGGFLLTSFGVDPSGRYFVPMYWCFALAAGAVISALKVQRLWKMAIIALVVVYQGWGTVDCALRNPPGLTTQFFAPTVYDHSHYPELIAFLERVGETRGYSTYWISYPLAFRSQEALIFAPALPYHPDLSYAEGDDRYPKYSELAAQAETVAYLALRGSNLEAYLQMQFDLLDVGWKKETIGDFVIFYNLTEKVQPGDIGLGSIKP